jgi:hypothetical protein
VQAQQKRKSLIKTGFNNRENIPTYLPEKSAGSLGLGFRYVYLLEHFNNATICSGLFLRLTLLFILKWLTEVSSGFHSSSMKQTLAVFVPSNNAKCYSIRQVKITRPTLSQSLWPVRPNAWFGHVLYLHS